MNGEPTLLNASPAALWTRRLKIAALGVRRLVAWQTRTDAFPAPRFEARPFAHVLASSRIPLHRPDAHPLFEAGKKHNLALAAPSFDGLLLSPGRPFSFWRALGRVTEARGFRHGMELAGGCIVPAIGGGLCLMARALFQVAALGGLRIIERHGHSMQAVEPPPGVPFGIDATVLWPYVDLRFEVTSGLARLGVVVRDEALFVTLTGPAPLAATYSLEAIDERITREADGRIRHNRIVRHRVDALGRRTSEDLAVNRTRQLSPEKQRRSCLTCGETACHARVEVPA
ncbi:MAG: VanW family protein [Myxococcaceae bacterium]|nr:VanW family protein [Myxococcaceae bacterium]